jgi:hypothetical protein
MRWIFWDVDFDALDPVAHADAILARVLERGRLEYVNVILDRYGEAAVHDFFRRTGGLDVSERTRAFWRAFFGAKNEPWATPPAWRLSSAAPWIG